MRNLIVLALFAGCGDTVRHTPDAPIAIDSPTVQPDAPANLVSIRVTAASAPVTGVVVHFQNADSSLVTTAMTDATGVASTMMANGGYVTAVDPFGTSSEHLYTFAGVKGGDHLILNQPAAPAAVTFTLIFPPDTNDVGLSGYKLHTNCGNQDNIQPTGSTISLSGCGSMVDMLIEAHDGNGNSLSALYHPDVAITSGGTVTLTDTLTLVNLTSLTFNNASNVTGGRLYINGALASPKGIVHTFPQQNLTATNGSATASVRIPSFTGLLQIIDTNVNLTGSGSQHVIEWRAPSSSYTLDVETPLLQSYATFPQFDPVTHTFTWTLTGTGPQGDFVVADGSFARSSASRSWGWTMVAPASGATLVLPTIPAGSFDFNGASGDTGGLNNLVTAKVPGGYDAVRAGVLATTSPLELISGTSGALVYEMTD